MNPPTNVTVAVVRSVGAPLPTNGVVPSSNRLSPGAVALVQGAVSAAVTAVSDAGVYIKQLLIGSTVTISEPTTRVTDRPVTVSRLRSSPFSSAPQQPSDTSVRQLAAEERVRRAPTPFEADPQCELAGELRATDTFTTGTDQKIVVNPDGFESKGIMSVSIPGVFTGYLPYPTTFNVQFFKNGTIVFSDTVGSTAYDGDLLDAAGKGRFVTLYNNRDNGKSYTCAEAQEFLGELSAYACTKGFSGLGAMVFDPRGFGADGSNPVYVMAKDGEGKPPSFVQFSPKAGLHGAFGLPVEATYLPVMAQGEFASAVEYRDPDGVVRYMVVYPSEPQRNVELVEIKFPDQVANAAISGTEGATRPSIETVGLSSTFLVTYMKPTETGPFELRATFATPGQTSTQPMYTIALPPEFTPDPNSTPKAVIDESGKGMIVLRGVKGTLCAVNVEVDPSGRLTQGATTFLPDENVDAFDIAKSKNGSEPFRVFTFHGDVKAGERMIGVVVCSKLPTFPTPSSQATSSETSSSQPTPSETPASSTGAPEDSSSKGLSTQDVVLISTFGTLGLVIVAGAVKIVRMKHAGHVFCSSGHPSSAGSEPYSDAILLE